MNCVLVGDICQMYFPYVMVSRSRIGQYARNNASTRINGGLQGVLLEFAIACRSIVF